VRRRTFIAGLGSVAAWPAVARAQQPDRMRRIGVLIGADESDPVWKTRLSAFTQALANLGWTESRNVRMDLRWRGDDTNQTLGNMRKFGVRSLDVSCWLCHHQAVLSADRWPDHVPVPTFGPRMVCTCCGIVGADARPMADAKLPERAFGSRPAPAAS
jgi:hypothetical protein